MIHITEDFISGIIENSRASVRRRGNYNFHRHPSDTLQRMINVMEPDTYVQPHKHENPDKREAFIILKGKVAVIEFSNDGAITEYLVLDRGRGNYGVEIPPRTWHTLICMEPDTVLYEVKDGPYDPEDDKRFATWAPGEGSEGTMDYNREILKSIGA
jgi:cupin fold WbuC family metalloprotein